MTNAIQAAPGGSIEIRLGAKTYKPTFSFGLLRTIEEVSGLDPWKFDWDKGLSPRQIHAFLWGLMTFEDQKRYTASEIDAIYPMFDEQAQLELAEVVIKMLGAAMVETIKKSQERDGAKNGEPATDQPIGSNSGQSVVSA